MTAKPDIPGAYFFQALASILLIPVSFALGVTLRNPVVGLLAATFAAFYPPFADGPRDLLSEPLGTLLLASAFLALAIAVKSPSWMRFSIAGALFGVTALTRADLMPVPLLITPLLVALLVTRVGLGRALRAAGAFALMTVITIAPWSIHVSSEVGEFTPITAGGAPAFWVGTFLPGGGSLTGLTKSCRSGDPELRFAPATVIKEGKTQSRRLCAPASAVVDGVARLHPEVSPSEALSRETKRNLERYALGRPLAFSGLISTKVIRMWGDYAREGGRANIPALPAVRTIHLLLVAVGVLGLLAGLRSQRRRPFAILALTVCLASTAVHTLATAQPRYAVPLLPVLVASGLAGFPDPRGRRSANAPPDTEERSGGREENGGT